MKQKDLSEEVVDALHHVNVWSQRIKSGKCFVGGKNTFADFGSPGTPHVVVLSPVYGWLYTKKQGGLTEPQMSWYIRARENGVPVHIVHSTDEARRVVDRWKADKRAMLEPVSLEVDAL